MSAKTKLSEAEKAAKTFRDRYFLNIALAAAAGSEGDLREACDIGEHALGQLFELYSLTGRAALSHTDTRSETPADSSSSRGVE